MSESECNREVVREDTLSTSPVKRTIEDNQSKKKRRVRTTKEFVAEHISEEAMNRKVCFGSSIKWNWPEALEEVESEKDAVTLPDLIVYYANNHQKRHYGSFEVQVLLGEYYQRHLAFRKELLSRTEHLPWFEKYLKEMEDGGEYFGTDPRNPSKLKYHSIKSEIR